MVIKVFKLIVQTYQCPLEFTKLLSYLEVGSLFFSFLILDIYSLLYFLISSIRFIADESFSSAAAFIFSLDRCFLDLAASRLARLRVSSILSEYFTYVHTSRNVSFHGEASRSLPEYQLLSVSMLYPKHLL